MLEQEFNLAKKQYQSIGVDIESAMERLSKIKISIHCWQGDDIKGFMRADSKLTGGILATGDYPGAAKTPNELRSDLEKALSFIPGKHKIALQAIYAESDSNIDYDEIEPKHFKNWVSWAKKNDVGLDFNASFFSHPKTNTGFTLSSNDKEIRNFWIRHAKKSREISEYIAKGTGQICVNNIWIADGFKDIPVDRLSHRLILKEALDEILETKYENVIDSVESKLFGIGSESYVVGSHEFYMGYAMKKNISITLDTGHFHLTENVGDKLTAIYPFINHIFLHVSRPIRWDSDHVIIMDDNLTSISEEIIRNNLLDKVSIGLDFFDASINRVAAWTIGTRNIIKCLLKALLQPTDMLMKYEREYDYTHRLAMLEEIKTYPFGAIWDEYCLRKNVAIRESWLEESDRYEKEVLSKRK